MPKKLTTEEFIKRAKKVHGNKYDYSKVKYINYLTKVIIICRKHGEFEQDFCHHINREQGCVKCGKIKRGKNERKRTGKGIVQKFIKVHGNKYNYSKVKYINSNTKVTIICPEHGKFEQTPSHHLRGVNCPKCRGLYKTTKEIIQGFRKVHGNKYDYSKFEYVNWNRKGIIICPKHGEFKQSSNNHLGGRGCPFCTLKSQGEVKILLEKYFSDFNIKCGKKIWNSYKNYNHRRYCDFWLEKDGLKIMVEYDGETHFVPIRFNGISFKKAQENFKNYQLKDKLDAEFCRENGIILHRIKYDEDKEESVKRLKKTIQQLVL